MNEEEHKLKKSQFLENYSRIKGLVKACRATSLTFQTISRWREEDEEFDTAINLIKEEMAENLESACYNAAMGGSAVDRIFLLKAMRPHIYRDFYAGSVHNTGVFIVPKEITVEQWGSLFNGNESKEIRGAQRPAIENKADEERAPAKNG